MQDATLTIGRNPRSYRELNKDDVDFGSYDTASRGDADVYKRQWWMRGHDPQTEDDLVNTAEAMVLRVLSR